VSKLSLIGILLLCMFSCIEPFQPEIDETADLLVINGNITDRAGWHSVEVSISSPLNEPGFIPVTGCIVRVEDDKGQGVTYDESRSGIYGANLDESFLVVDRAYKLYVFTPDGNEYQSDFDPLLSCPPVDTVYYSKEKQKTENSNVTYSGLQFYVDVIGEAGDSRNFLWKLNETYEYHSYENFDYFWDMFDLKFYDPPSDSLWICYRSRQIPELFTASSRYLIVNELHGFPLNFVSSRSHRLGIAYGLFVSQYSLSDEAFLYWDKMRNQLSESGGLYDKQPSGSEGNIYNVNDPEEQVLGYFYSSQIQENWVLFKNRGNFSVRPFTYNCDTLETWPSRLRDPLPPNYLFSIDSNDEVVGPPFVTGRHCLNCTDWGGVLEPPEYWNKDE